MQFRVEAEQNKIQLRGVKSSAIVMGLDAEKRSWRDVRRCVRFGFMELLNKMPVVRPVRDKDEFIRLNNEAFADDHFAITPTHVFEKGGEIVGYANVGTMVPVNTWFHSKM